jgi:transposase
VTASGVRTLAQISRSSSRQHRSVQQAKALLMAADGVANAEIAKRLEVSRNTVLGWRARFETCGLEDFGKVRPGRGRKPTIPEEKVVEIVDLTLHSTPVGETHWSTRTMARATGASNDTVQRIWSARGIKPHLVKTFKISNDKVSTPVQN